MLGEGAGVRDAGEDKLDEVPVERLEEEITTLAGHLNAGMCGWLLLVAEFDRRDGWAAWGCRSCAQWLSWRCGVAPGAAREQLRVARSVAGLAGVRAEFEAGRLSYSQVRALTRVASGENEEELLALARHATEGVAFPGAVTTASSMGTTSPTGPTEGRRASRTSCCSAAIITGWCTRAATGWSADPVGGVVFRRPDGRRVPDHPQPCGGTPAAVREHHGRHGPSIDADTAVTGWQGDPLDLGLVTELLLCHDERCSGAYRADHLA